jgi:acetyltransferase-like isoleucine patch superfamily enzyme
MLQGADIGANTLIRTPFFIAWPHCLLIGDDVMVEPGCSFKHDGPYKTVKSIKIGSRTFIGCGVEFNVQHCVAIGEDCLIASGVRFIDHNHSVVPGHLTNTLPCVGKPISIGANAWIGANAVILSGVAIGDSAVVGAGSLVNRDIPPGELWAGVPARKIRSI